jgi:hypothetical protein
MLRRSKRLILAVAAASAAVVIPSTPASAMAPCQAKVGFTAIEYRQTLAVTGVYTSAGAIDVQLTCGIVRNGVTVARISESAPGPVAAVAGTANVSAGTFTVCHEIVATYLDKPPYVSDWCP